MRVLPVAANRERIPLTDEIDHVAFGVSRLKQELAGLSEAERRTFLERLPARITTGVRGSLEERRRELIAELAVGCGRCARSAPSATAGNVGRTA